MEMMRRQGLVVGLDERVLWEKVAESGEDFGSI